jgi:polyphosphate kinase
VAEFIETAARDPQVLAIKQTLYRVGQNSPIVQALLEANERGKQVAVLVELKARFDEENNIEWARTLERAGVHVVYGQVDLKTHAKVALVVRRESSGLRCYVHLGTGNYNSATARVYEDLALLTCRPEIAEDVINLFNALTGYARGLTYRQLLVAPGSLRRNLLERIEREIAQQQVSGQGRIMFKTNALVDAEIIQALYRASQAGVQIDLIVRGMCCLRPGIKGVSENIRVVSLVGRILEHSRIYYFANGGVAEDEVFVGSADLMPRNLDHRVEVLFPILDPVLRAHLTQVVLPAYLFDTINARRMLSDGTYEHLASTDEVQARNVHLWFAHEGHQDQSREPLLTLHAAGIWAPSL